MHRRREQKFSHFLKKKEDVLYCSDIAGLVNEFGNEYKDEEWRLIIGSSKTSLNKFHYTMVRTTFTSLLVDHSVEELKITSLYLIIILPYSITTKV